MKHKIQLCSIALTTIFLSSSIAEAQMQARAQASPPSADKLQSPDIPSQTRQKRFTPLDWAEIEGAITIEVRPEPQSGMLDRLLVKWYVAVKDPDKNGQFLLLTREINHVNVPIGDEFFSSVYLSPSTVRRITGKSRAADKAPEMIGYEVIFNGEVIASAANRGARDKWWTIPSEKISLSDGMPLMIKPETPFAAMWWDRYAEIAVEK